MPAVYGSGCGGGDRRAAADSERQTRQTRPAGTGIPGRRYGYRAPATPTEEILAGIYAQVLGLERVGVDDSFFELGGDSLSAMRVIAAINKSLDAGIAVRTVFEAPTVAQLAPRIGAEAVGWRRWWPGSGRRWCRCRLPSPGCGSLTSCEGPSPVYNMAVALRLGGRLDAEALGAALGDVVGRHESLRTLFVAADGDTAAAGGAGRAGRFRLAGR